MQQGNWIMEYTPQKHDWKMRKPTPQPSFWMVCFFVVFTFDYVLSLVIWYSVLHTLGGDDRRAWRRPPRLGYCSIIGVSVQYF